MFNWASSILVVPKKPDLNVSSTTDNTQFNLRLCIDYQKLNNRILTAKQIKADGRLGKVLANYPQPTIDNILAHFKDCKHFFHFRPAIQILPHQANIGGCRKDSLCN